MFQNAPFYRFLFNSFIVTGLIVVGQLITASMAGYAFAKCQFRGRNGIFWLVLATMMVPIQATIIPVFILIKYMHLSDTLTALILPAVATAFGTFLLRQAFMQMPKDFGEAAVVDGASQWRVFTRIYLPMAWPALATLAVLDFAGYWNEFFRPLIFLNSQNKYTLPLGLGYASGLHGHREPLGCPGGGRNGLDPELDRFRLGPEVLRPWYCLRWDKGINPLVVRSKAHPRAPGQAKGEVPVAPGFKTDSDSRGWQ